jgi:hypothetical protein
MYLSWVFSVCIACILASPSPPPSSGEQPPPPSSGEQLPLPPPLSTLYSPSSPTPPSVRDVSPPRQYVARNSLTLGAREHRPKLRVLLFCPSPPSLPLPWETPRRINYEDIVWAGAERHPAGRRAQMPAIDLPIHPQYLNDDQQRPASPSPPVESEQFWLDGLNEVQRADAQLPRTEADQEWDDHVSSADQEWDDQVDEAAYECASAYSPTSYERRNGYSWCAAARGAAGAAASRGRRMLRDESRAAIAAALQQESREASAAAIECAVA